MVNGFSQHPASLFKPPLQFVTVALSFMATLPFIRRESSEIVQLKLDFGFAVNLAILRSRCQSSMAWPSTSCSRLFNRLSIGGTNQWNGLEKMTVVTDKVCAIFHHVPLQNQAGAQHSQSPIVAKRGAVITKP